MFLFDLQTRAISEFVYLTVCCYSLSCRLGRHRWQLATSTQKRHLFPEAEKEKLNVGEIPRFELPSKKPSVNFTKCWDVHRIKITVFQAKVVFVSFETKGHPQKSDIIFWKYMKSIDAVYRKLVFIYWTLSRDYLQN